MEQTRNFNLPLAGRIQHRRKTNEWKETKSHRLWIFYCQSKG